LDGLRAALIAGAISQRERDVEIVIQSSRATETAIRSLYACGLGQLFWKHGVPSSSAIRPFQVRAPVEALASKELRILSVEPSQLVALSRQEFQAAVVRLLASADITVPGRVQGAIGTICFETASNAEEHGAADVYGAYTDKLRYLFARVHSDFGKSLAPEASQYLDAFHSAQPPSRDWLEIVVCDAGMGISYPSYHIWAKDTGRPGLDVYSVDAVEERLRLGMILNSTESTKGRWGRVLNRETERGDGTRFIKFRLAACSGYAAVRSGRSMAEWFFAKPERKPVDVREQGAYSVHNVEYSLYRGTVWYILTPLTPQLALSL
jgi:hypothetical protein